MRYRKADKGDFPGMARIRAAEWETQEYWEARISGYLNCEINPGRALMPRVAYVAVEDTTLEKNAVRGFIAGHLTRRYECDGELEWINVVPEWRGTGVASELLRLLSEWFAGHYAPRICVNVEPGNTAATRFYFRNGAEKLNEHWLVWEDITAVSARIGGDRHA